jgi:hypothetical protein
VNATRPAVRVVRKSDGFRIVRAAYAERPAVDVQEPGVLNSVLVRTRQLFSLNC